MKDQKQDIVEFGMIGTGFQIKKNLIPKIQIDWHSPFYKNSDLKQLSSWSAQLTIGATFILSDKAKTFLDFGIVEDIVLETAPDVVFHFALYKKF